MSQQLTKQDIQEIVAEAIERAVGPAVNKHVNGHIKDLRAELEPLIAFGATMHNLRRFIVWFMQPIQGIILIIAAIGALVAFLK